MLRKQCGETQSFACSAISLSASSFSIFFWPLACPRYTVTFFFSYRSLYRGQIWFHVFSCSLYQTFLLASFLFPLISRSNTQGDPTSPPLSVGSHHPHLNSLPHSPTLVKAVSPVFICLGNSSFNWDREDGQRWERAIVMLKAVNGCHQTLAWSTDCSWSPLSSAGAAQGTGISHLSLPSFLIFLQLRKGLTLTHIIPWHFLMDLMG